MIKLSLLDQLIYDLDATGMPIVMQGGAVLDPSTAPAPLDADALADHLADRLTRIPLMRHKVVRDPFGIGNLRLVEDPDFDPREHVTRATLPPPGDEAALLHHLEEFSVQKLDLTKPLWRWEVVDGLEGGKIAICSKLHHAIMDGVGSVEILDSIYDAEPLPADPLRAGRRRARLHAPSRLELVGRALGDVGARLLAGPRFLRHNSRALLGSLAEALRERVRWGGDAEEAPSVPRTSLNTEVSPDRRVVAYRVYDLAELKALTKKLGCSINDVAMLLCSVAMDRYFRGIGETLESDLFAMMPMNMRKATGDTAVGNAMLVASINLHTRIPQLLDRLRAIQRDARQARDQARPEDESSVDLMEAVEMFSPLLIDAVAALAGRLVHWPALIERFTFVNTLISNVPGPRGQRYIGGARVEHSIPMIPVTFLSALSWGILSFGGRLTIGFHGCGEAVRDKELLIEGLDKAYAELQTYAGA